MAAFGSLRFAPAPVSSAFRGEGFMDRKKAKWVLFITMALTVPVVFFLFQVAMFVPMAAIIVVSFTTGSWFLSMGLIHTAIFAPMLWGISSLIVSGIKRIPRTDIQWVIYMVFIVSFTSLAWLSPYVAGGHSNDQDLSWLQTFRPFP